MSAKDKGNLASRFGSCGGGQIFLLPNGRDSLGEMIRVAFGQEKVIRPSLPWICLWRQMLVATVENDLSRDHERQQSCLNIQSQSMV